MKGGAASGCPWGPGLTPGPDDPCPSWPWDPPDAAEPASALQDYIFYLEPERLESGKGKCPYDPKLDTASALISECPAPPRSCSREVWPLPGGGGWHRHLPQVDLLALNPHGGACLAGRGVQLTPVRAEWQRLGPLSHRPAPQMGALRRPDLSRNPRCGPSKARARLGPGPMTLQWREPGSGLARGLGGLGNVL